MLAKKGFKYVAVLLVIAVVALSGIAFSPQDENFFTVTGLAVYSTKDYSDLRVNVKVTQDGKSFKTFKCDSKGRFETQIYPNHVYMFHFSMDYHATSKVEVSTFLPEEKTQDYVGGLFNFDCEMFERLEGLNLSLLNNPLVKIKYNSEKNDFEYDKKYTERMLYNLEGFREQLAEMKQRRKDVLKNASESKKSVDIAKTEPVIKERKPIAFESEKEKPKAVNKRGARNIMDMEEEEEEITAELKEADSIMEHSEAVVMEESDAPTEISAEDLELEQALDESDFITLKVIPKRMDINDSESEDKKNREKYAMTKLKTQEVMALKRIDQETRIREEIRSFSTRASIKHEKRLANKKIQNERLGDLIKSVAIAEIFHKKEYYGLHPITHDYVDPSIFKREQNSWWVDKEYTTLMYPSQSVRYRKEVYPLGITYYYLGDEEIDEETYCSGIEQFSKSEITCVN